MEHPTISEKMEKVDDTDYKNKQRLNILGTCLHILDALNRGETPTTKELVEELGGKLRNMQNYIKLLEPFGVVREGRERRLTLSRALNYKKTSLTPEERAFVHSALEQLEEIDEEHKKMAESIAKKIMVAGVESPFYIKPEQFEPIYKQQFLIDELERAVENHLKIELIYEGKPLTLFPYKIIAFEGIWYLLADGVEDDSIRNYMITRINTEELYITPQQFKPIDDLMQHIEEMESAHSTEEDEREVIVKVKADIADYFKYKKHLKSQDILEEDEEGNLIISYDITHDEDIDNMIKSWLPDIEVLSPQSFKSRLKRELETYLSQLT